MKTKKYLAALIEPIGRFHSRAANGEEKLWKVWWIAGIPLGWASGALVVIAEDMRYVGHPGWGDFMDVLRFLVFFAWLRFSWRCSLDHVEVARNIQRRPEEFVSARSPQMPARYVRGQGRSTPSRARIHESRTHCAVSLPLRQVSMRRA